MNNFNHFLKDACLLFYVDECSAWMYVHHMCSWCPRRAGKVMRSPGIGATGGNQPPFKCWEPRNRQEWVMPLTAEPSSRTLAFPHVKALTSRVHYSHSVCTIPKIHFLVRPKLPSTGFLRPNFLVSDSRHPTFGPQTFTALNTFISEII